MGTITSYGKMLIGLLIALIVLMVLLNLGKKLPVVGKVVEDAQSLATHGTL